MADELAPEPIPADPPPNTDFDPSIASVWRGRITRAENRQKKYHKWWEAATKAYAPGVNDAPDTYGNDVRTNRIFTIVERKSAELFYQKPELTVAPSPLLEALGESGTKVAAAHSVILNEKLGLDGVNVRGLARRAIFDYELYAAGWTVMGYRAYTVIVEQPITDPMGTPLRDEVGQPAMRAQPVIIKSECFWENLSPKQALIPAEWTSTEFDKAPWLGWTFANLPKNDAVRQWNLTLPPDFQGSGSEKTREVAFDLGDQSDTLPQLETLSGTVIYYKSATYRDDTVHPDALHELILIDGLDAPAVHRPLPLQSFDQRGQLTPDSLIGFPMHPLVIRTQTDAAYLMSDVNIALPIVNELDTYRKQMVDQRDGSLPKWIYNTEVIGADDAKKLASAPQNGMIGLSGDAFTKAGPGGPLMPLQQTHYAQENYKANDYLDNDLARTHGLDATSAGTSGESGLTATEANLRQANVNIRLGWEQGFVADWFVGGATKYSTIVQKFFPIEQAIAIVGQPDATLWDQWRHASPSRLSFTITPDSSLRNDTPLERKQLQDLYTFLANDPSLNRTYLNRKLVEKFHLDPTKAILPPAQVPKPQPEPSIPTVAIKDLPILMNPAVLAFIDANPQWGIVIPQVVKAAIADMPADAALLGMATGGATSPPEHGGKVPQAEGLSKHAADLTGAQNGSGQLTPQTGLVQ